MPNVTIVYAWVATEADGGEGVCAMQIDDTWYPMIGTLRSTVELQRPQAEALARATGRPMQLVAFTTRTVIEDLTPGGRP